MIVFFFLLITSFTNTVGTFFQLPLSSNSRWQYNHAQKFSYNSLLETHIGFEHSLGHQAIRQSLFKPILSSSHFIDIAGSQTTQRSNTALLADYFYLPHNFKSIIKLNPSIQILHAGVQYTQNIDSENKKWFLHCVIPFSFCTTDLHTTEYIQSNPHTSHDVGYFVADDSFSAHRCLQKATDYFEGKTVFYDHQEDDFNATTFKPLKYARWKQGQHKSAFINCALSLHYQAYKSDNTTLYCGVQTQLPLGAKPQASYLFESTTGSNYHWHLGGIFEGQTKLYENENGQLLLSGYLTFEHLFKAQSQRVFDLKNKPFSRYMLAQKLGAADPSDMLIIGQQLSDVQFKKEFCPLANLTHMTIETQTSFLSTGGMILSGLHKKVTWNSGINYIIGTPEKINLAQETTPFVSNTTWALKGDAQMYGFKNNTTKPTALAATQNEATIFSGKNFPARGTDNPSIIVNARKNNAIDNKAIAQQSPFVYLQYDPDIPFSYNNLINGSNPPRYIREQDIDFASAQIQQAACSLFFSFSYRPDTIIDGWEPVITCGTAFNYGFGGSHDQYNRSHYQSSTIWIQGSLAH